MATQDEMKTALRNAHLAGDVESARRIAQAMRQPDQRSVSRKVVDFGSEVIQKAKGDKTLPQYNETPFILRGGQTSPEAITPNPQGEVSIKNMIGTARGNALGEAQIFQKTFPDADVDFEENSGLPVIYLKDQTPTKRGEGVPHYLNKPGLSAADVVSGGQEMLLEIMSAIPAARALRGAGSLGRIAGASIGAGGASVGQDAIAQALGSEQPIDVKRAGIIAALGAGGELAAPVVEKALRSFYRSNNFVRNGQLTPEGAKYVTETFGVDPRVAQNPEFIQMFSETAPIAQDPAAAARLSAAETLPTPVRLSRGDVSQDVVQQGKEFDIERGVYGQDAATIANRFREDQARDIQANLEAIRPSQQVTRKGEGAAIAVQGLRDAKELAEQEVREAYELARNTKAFVPAELSRDMGKNAGKLLRKTNPLFKESTDDLGPLGEFDIEEMPSLKRRLNELRTLTSTKADIGLDKFEKWRQRIIANPGATPAEQKALRILKQQYDGFLDGAIDNALLKGDEKAVTAWKNARLSNKMLKEKFSDNKIIDTLVRKDLSPEEAANYLLGASSLGGKQGTLGALKKIKEGVKPEQWNALREEALLKVVRVKPGKEFSRQDLVTAIDRLQKENPSVYEFLFDERERNILNQLKTVSKFTNTNPKARDPGSAMPLIRSANNVFGDFGKLMQIIGGKAGLQYLNREFAQSQARNMGVNTLAVKKLFPDGFVGGLSAGATSPVTEPDQ